MKTSKFIFVVLFVVLLFALSNTSTAHSGRTDSKGGHYNNSTGTYHYHHGYSEHSHYDIDGDGNIDCPYIFDDNTHNNNNSSNNSKDDSEYKITFRDVLQIILVVVFFFYPLFAVTLLIIGKAEGLIDKVYKKIAKKDINISATDRYWKVVYIVISVVIVASITILMLHLKGII